MGSNISNIFIIGYMGCGKTTIGLALAKKLGKDFLDMDDTIEKEQAMPMGRIFMKYGEHQFRNLEAELLDKIVEKGGSMIVSCGGGIILDSANRDILREEFAVFLKCDTKTMFARIKNNPDLPNAYFHIDDEKEREQVFTGQYEKRKDFYESASDITVDTDGKDSDDIVSEIIEKIGDRI